MRSLYALTIIGLGLSLAGCGGGSSKVKNIVPVRGTITVDGKPLDHGTVGFAPVDPKGQPAVGEVKNGQFRMMTSPSAQGVKTGDYHVSVISVDPNSVPKRPENLPPDPNEKRPEPTSLISKKYNDIKTSELDVSVKPDMAPLEFDLTSGK